MSGVLSATGKTLGKAVPGTGGGDQEKGNTEQEVREQGGNLAAGVVGKTGEIVDDTGKTVGKITEGEPGDLVGNVVTATGDIVGKDGGVVGKALAIGEDGEEAKEGSGFSLMGAAKGVKGVVDTADGTIQTVNRSLPLVGDLTKGLGLGGEKSDSQEGSSLLGGVLGTKASERDPQEAAETTENAKKELFEVNDKTSEVAPIDLKDAEGDGAANTEVETKSQPPISEYSETSNTEFTEQTGATGDDDGKADEARDRSEKTLPDDVKAEDLAKGNVTEKAQSTAEDAKDGAEETAEAAKEGAEDTADGAQSQAEGAADEAKSQAEGAGDEAKSQAEGAAEGAEDAADGVKSQAEEGAEEAQSQADDAKSRGTTEKVQSEIDDMATVTIPGDKVPNPFEKFEGAQIDDEGKVIYENESIGKAVEGEPEDVANQNIDGEGNIIDSEGNIIGKAELKSEIADDIIAEAVEAADLSALKGCTVNKAGNLVNDKGQAIGRITEGTIKNIIGRAADEQGQIWNDSGKVIGQAELIPENEREEFKEPSPFEDFPEATVQSNGEVHHNGEIVGRLIEGDAKQLKGKKVDEDGDIQDRQGNVIGKAERWEPEPEEEPEPEQIDNSILAGKRVNKAGNIVDSNGNIFGKLVEGDAKRLAGKMCDKNGNVMSESGDVLGKAEVIPEGDREGVKDGPFSELSGCTVNKEGHIVTPGGDIVGRLTSGDPKVLFGREVDEDGDILDGNGNKIGTSERWEPEPEPERPDGPLKDLYVNKQGEVYDQQGNLRAKLTSGDLSICAGKQIDNDNDVVDAKGNTVGHVSLIEDIPQEEEEETEEQKKEREQAEKDEKLAKDLGGLIEQGLEKVRPICKMITDKVDKAERTPKEELDEEALVKEVKPLLEEGGKILNELNGTIRAFDPDGRIQRNAKHKSNTKEASPAEYHLADVLKELTETVTTCIDNGKRKIDGMPHAKKELSPLWGLLSEPLFQILAAVGLLLTGVLNLVGRLLNGLGLGGIIDGLLGSLGLNRLLDGLGLGSLTDALGGGKKKNKSS